MHIRPYILTRWLLAVALMMSLMVCQAALNQPQEQVRYDSQHSVIDVDLFISSTCPHCHQADDFLSELSIKHTWLKIHRHVINEDKTQLELFYQKLQAFHVNDFSVPTIMFCDSRWVGFKDAETTGKGLLRALNFCHHQIETEGALTEVTRNTLRQWSGTSASNMKLDINQPTSLLERIVISALMEAISPCSLFCILMFLSFLWLYPDSRRVRFYVGTLFIAILAVMHTSQFVLTTAYQQWFLYVRWVSLLSGVSLIAFVIQYYRAQARPERQLSMAWIVPVMLLGVATAYSFQQTCDFSVGALFQQWLQTQTLTLPAFYFCQMTYLLFYVLPLIVVLGFYLIFNVHPRKILPASACLILLLMGVLLFVYPDGLSNLIASCVVLVASVLMSWRYTKYSNMGTPE